MQRSDLIQKFQNKAEAVQAVVTEIESLSDAIRYTIDLTQQQEGRTIAAPGLGDEDNQILREACQSSGLTLLESPLRPEANHIHTALTLVDGGIAETGSLILNSAFEDIRIATMLAETHVAIVKAASIIPDTDALEEQLDAVLKTDAPSYTAFITGGVTNSRH